jgi:hypothetical protein
MSFTNRRNRADADITPEQSKYVFVSLTNGYTMNADLQIEIYQEIIELGTLTGNIDVFLPPVAEAKGRTYHIYMTNAASAATVQPYMMNTAIATPIAVAGDDARNWPSANYALTAADDFVTLTSNGDSWVEVDFQTT